MREGGGGRVRSAAGMATSPYAGYERVLHGHRLGGHLGPALGGRLYAARQRSGASAAVIDLLDASVAAAPGFRGRFERDVALLRSFAHPHVVALRDCGHADDATYLVLDPLDGPRLSELIAIGGPLEPGRVAELVAQVATALDAAHRRGLVHRGLSPASIVVRDRGGAEQAAIMDFAVADDTARYGGLLRCPAGTAPPPVHYAAPEQVRGEPSGPRADVYALGAILFHALTARPPFPAPTFGATLEAHLHAPVPPAGGLVAGIPDGFEAVLARALAKDPADRYASASELAGALPAKRASLSIWRSMLVDPAPDVEDEPYEAPAAGDTVAWDGEADEPRPAPRPAATYHFRRARAYDSPAEEVSYGPEEPGLAGADELRWAAGPPRVRESPPTHERTALDELAARPGRAAFDEPVARPARAAFDGPSEQLDFDDYEELPEDVDVEGFEAVALDATQAPRDPAAAAPARATGADGDGQGPPPAGSRRRPEGRDHRRPGLQPIDSPVSSRGRRRGGHGPKPALLIAAGLLLLVTTGVLAVVGAFDGDDGSGAQRAARPTIAATARSEAAALARRSGAASSRQTAGTQSGRHVAGSGAATTGSAATAAVPAAQRWPAGRSAYTAIVYVSSSDRATAVSRARRAARLGVRTGVLRSSDFANLEPGMWVAFAGISDSERTARRTADRLRAAGLAAAPYPRRVESR